MTRIAFVHAHPDDETIATGALIAHLGRTGHEVVLLTATRGEMGEVVPGPLSHLEGTPELESHRERELAGALEVLGIRTHAFLGGADARAAGLEPRRYLDSGMRWIREGLAGPAEESDERSLCAADEEAVAGDIAAWLSGVGAEMVITYDAGGGYGHPDHVRTHDATRRAAESLGLPIAFIVHDEARAEKWFRLEHMLTTTVEALRHHATQVSVSGAVLTHSGGQSEPVITTVGLSGDLELLAGKPRYRHVFWDMGGTMVNTYPELDAALADVVRARGAEVSDAEVAVLTRVSTGEAITSLAQRFGVPQSEFEAAESALKRSWQETPAPAMPGLAEVMAAASGLNLVVTHRDRASASSLLEGLGIVVDDMVSTDDGHPRKPDPTMYKVLLERHGLDPLECLAVGDRSIDAEAAAAAGMATVMLTGAGIPTRVQGDLCVEDLRELLPLIS